MGGKLWEEDKTRAPSAETLRGTEGVEDYGIKVLPGDASSNMTGKKGKTCRSHAQNQKNRYKGRTEKRIKGSTAWAPPKLPRHEVVGGKESKMSPLLQKKKEFKNLNSARQTCHRRI